MTGLTNVGIKISSCYACQQKCYNTCNEICIMNYTMHSTALRRGFSVGMLNKMHINMNRSKLKPFKCVCVKLIID